jgi:hypothetical protein
VLVIGGGVIGGELAGDTTYAKPKAPITLAYNSDVLLNRFEATDVLPNNAYIKVNLSHTLNDFGYARVNEKLEVVGENNLYA